MGSKCVSSGAVRCGELRCGRGGHLQPGRDRTDTAVPRHRGYSSSMSLVRLLPQGTSREMKSTLTSVNIFTMPTNCNKHSTVFARVPRSKRNTFIPQKPQHSSAPHYLREGRRSSKVLFQQPLHLPQQTFLSLCPSPACSLPLRLSRKLPPGAKAVSSPRQRRSIAVLKIARRALVCAPAAAVVAVAAAVAAGATERFSGVDMFEVSAKVSCRHRQRQAATTLRDGCYHCTQSRVDRYYSCTSQRCPVWKRVARCVCVLLRSVSWGLSQVWWRYRSGLLCDNKKGKKPVILSPVIFIFRFCDQFVHKYT